MCGFGEADAILSPDNRSPCIPPSTSCLIPSSHPSQCGVDDRYDYSTKIHIAFIHQLLVPCLQRGEGCPCCEAPSFKFDQETPLETRSVRLPACGAPDSSTKPGKRPRSDTVAMVIGHDSLLSNDADRASDGFVKLCGDVEREHAARVGDIPDVCVEDHAVVRAYACMSDKRGRQQVQGVT